MDLGEILDELKAESPSRHPTNNLTYQEKLIGYRGLPGDTDLMARPEPPVDAPGEVIIKLTPHEAWWLEWRLRVHVRSYRIVQWTEMEGILNKIIQRLSEVKHGDY